MRTLSSIRALAGALALLLAACNAPREAGPPEARSARIVMPPPGASMAAGYFELRNPGGESIELVGVNSADFESVQMHETVEENGVSRMRPLSGAVIEPGQTLRFEPGGKHLMLAGPKAGSGTDGLRLQLVLRSRDGATRQVEVPFAVETVGGEDPHAHHHHH